MADRPVRVAIIGGGCAGVAAAFELSRPQHAGKFQVTLYQQGWRLGGKGASGRGASNRIEEHGLHLWMGFYENAFRLMRECYGELDRDPDQCRIASWRDAFAPDHYCGVMDRDSAGSWLPWTVLFPSTPGLPGDPEARRGWTVTDYLTQSATLVLTLLRAIQVKTGSEVSASATTESSGQAFDGAQRMSRWLRYGELASLTGLLQAVELLNMVVRNLPQYSRDLILQFHEQIAAAARAQLHARTHFDTEARRLWEIVDLTLAVIRGIVRFGLISDPRGFDAIDEYDCREWLKLNGASERAVDSAFVRALYDLAFGYEDGDVCRPRIAAGQAVRGAVRAFFTYRGAFFWKMQAGMGDVVFAPFYEVLKQRGVDFKFFHRLRNIGLGPASDSIDGESPYVQRLEFDVQAEVLGAYQPLIDVRGLPCWPAEPDWSQLVDGESLKAQGVRFESHWERRKVRTLQLDVIKDFDFVVLAVGLGAVPYVARELIERSPRWADMVKHCKTVATQAFQLWLGEDARKLGWQGERINISGFVEPFDTWADMSQLIQEEDFTDKVASVAYFCSVLADPPVGVDTQAGTYPETRQLEVRQHAVDFLEQHVQHLWPNAHSAEGGFRWALLCDADNSGASQAPADAGRFSTQFWTANVNPSDRYSLSLPGSLKFRISPLDSSIDNLTVAGDWTDCGFNEGCVEAAVMSGRLAAHALSRQPALEDITGFDHP